MERLTQGERILAIAGIVLFVSSFVDFWGNAELLPIKRLRGFRLLGGPDLLGRGDAWDMYGVAVQLGLIAALAAVLVVIAKGADLKLRLPFDVGLLYVGASGFATLMLLIGVLSGPSVPFRFMDIDRGVLLFVGLFLAAAMTYGGYLHIIACGKVRAPGSTPPADAGPGTESSFRPPAEE